MRGRRVVDQTEATMDIKGGCTIGIRTKTHFAERSSRFVKQAVDEQPPDTLSPPTIENVDMTQPSDVSSRQVSI